MKRTTLVGLGLLFAAFIAGCAHHTSGEDTDSTSMKLETSCSKTVCDAVQAAYSTELDQCFDAADMADGDPSMCESSSPTCTDQDRSTCSSTNWSFEVRAPADPTYQAACERERDHETACGTTVTDRADCATYAKVERPDFAHFYDCETALPCDQLATSMACAPPPGTFGDEVCELLSTLPGSKACSADLQLSLNEEAGWLRDDVVAAGRGCLHALDAQDLLTCVQAWLDTVAPPTTPPATP